MRFLFELAQGASHVNGLTGMFRLIPNTTTTPNNNHHTTGFKLHAAIVLRRHSQVKTNPGIASTNSAFKCSAVRTWPCVSSCAARVAPQPGQFKPVNACSGQGGKQDGGIK